MMLTACSVCIASILRIVELGVIADIDVVCMCLSYKA